MPDTATVSESSKRGRRSRRLATASAVLAAAAAAVLVLSRGKPMELQWQDAGSTPAEVATATAKLVRAGVDVVVGPPFQVDPGPSGLAAGDQRARAALEAVVKEAEWRSGAVTDIE